MLWKFQGAFAEAIFNESIVFGKELEAKGRACSHIAEGKPACRDLRKSQRLGSRSGWPPCGCRDRRAQSPRGLKERTFISCSGCVFNTGAGGRESVAGHRLAFVHIFSPRTSHVATLRVEEAENRKCQLTSRGTCLLSGYDRCPTPGSVPGTTGGTE